MGKRLEKLSLGLVVVFLKIGSCLGSLKLTRHSPQTALHCIVKLFASSTDYLLKIRELNSQQSDESRQKHNRNEPDRSFLHTQI